jgi:hypothetical protein
MAMSDSPDLQAAPATPEGVWPQSLDALAAAPDQQTLLYENDRVRVLDTCIRPGDQTPVLLDSRTVPALREPPPAPWSAPLPPHSLLNVDGADLHLISIEVKA